MKKPNPAYGEQFLWDGDGFISTATANMMVENYSPIMSEHDNNYYRVLVEQKNNLYTVHTGDNMTRILEDFSLPKEIRVKLTMIKAYEQREKFSASIDQLSASTSMGEMFVWSPMDLYSNTFPPEFSDIGWRCRIGSSREFYCVVTSAETLDSLRGEPL